MFGTNLKRIRQKKKLTQKDLAGKLGVSRQAICLWEANKRELKASILKDLARILGVKTEELMRAESGVNGSRIPFEWIGPESREVFLVGDFTGWKPTIPLRRMKNGIWRRNVTLPRPGRYEYKFVVDGQWQIDPKNADTILNQFGTLNSVKELT